MYYYKRGGFLHHETEAPVTAPHDRRLQLQNPERLQSIQKEIYITVASEYQTSIASVERDIRTVRDVMMKNGGEQLLIQMTGSPGWADKIPYPRDLIAIFAQYLLRESGQNP